MYIYIYIYIYVHTYIYIYIYIYTQNTYIYIYIHTHPKDQIILACHNLAMPPKGCEVLKGPPLRVNFENAARELLPNCDLNKQGKGVQQGSGINKNNFLKLTFYHGPLISCRKGVIVIVIVIVIVTIIVIVIVIVVVVIVLVLVLVIVIVIVIVLVIGGIRERGDPKRKMLLSSAAFKSGVDLGDLRAIA